jgi:hypothetical protein
LLHHNNFSTRTETQAAAAKPFVQQEKWLQKKLKSANAKIIASLAESLFTAPHYNQQLK